MAGHDGTIAAVLDWELCTLGDVLADLGGMVMWWGDDPDARGRLGDVPTRAPGFGSAEDMIARYTERSDRDLSNLPWYVAFQHWRLAASAKGYECATQPARWATRKARPTAMPRTVSTTCSAEPRRGPGLRPGHDDDLVVIADQPRAAIAAS